MSEGVIARRYARALFELAQEHNALDAVEADLKVVNQAIEDSPEFHNFLLHPQIDTKIKKEKMSNIFSGKITEQVFSLLLLLLDRRRENILSAMVQEFVKMANEARNIAEATFVSAVPLNSEELNEVGAQFGEKIKKTLRVANVVDPSIIGGLIVRIDDRLYDGSVKNKLSKFKHKLYRQG
ncbi:F0F1 ATP synthase subunit delta [Ferviditalea candida]|uniref:ATP synthase subunit delta n=1 Tax=Ferviditalea candida TaxID=3108399 RepID=A0ABU5ZJ45_9BACL|nr:F0F1 ATP synthase subunit delta [Paenibacillaceae bacterium T2]